MGDLKIPTRGLGVFGRSSGAPTLPAPSLGFLDPLSTSCGRGTPRPSPSAQPRTQPEFFHDVVDVNFDGATFNAKLARYFVV
jgi:hypothetical protein